MRPHPICYIIAGPNGAGKTTFAMEFLPQTVGCRNLFRHYMPLAHYCAIFDNSSAVPVLVYERDTIAERASRPAIFEKIRKQAGVV